MNVVLIDSPVANVANIERALRAVGASVERSADAATIATADKVVLPGVGSFGAAIDWVREAKLDEALQKQQNQGGALLGICVGHQLLFSSSDEMGARKGLGLADGEVSKFQTELPIPQIGWNLVNHDETSLLFEGVPSGTPFYFVNSYRAAESRDAVARANYGESFVAALTKKRLYGVQFHPEKSSSAGLRLLTNFVERG